MEETPWLFSFIGSPAVGSFHCSTSKHGYNMNGTTVIIAIIIIIKTLKNHADDFNPRMKRIKHKLSFSQEITQSNSSSGHGGLSLSITVVVSFPITGNVVRA